MRWQLLQEKSIHGLQNFIPNIHLDTFSSQKADKIFKDYTSKFLLASNVLYSC